MTRELKVCPAFETVPYENCGGQENDKEMVSNLLAFRARLDIIICKACEGNEAYHYKLKEAWEGFLNARSG